jgi:transcriptional regulator with XRE-family HTH domain
MVAPRDSGNTAAGAGAVVMAPILGVQSFLARTALGWTVAQLSRAAGVSFPAVKRFERGGAVKPRTAEAIQRALTISAFAKRPRY